MKICFYKRRYIDWVGYVYVFRKYMYIIIINEERVYEFEGD